MKLDRLTDIATILAGLSAVIVAAVIFTRGSPTAARAASPAISIVEDWEPYAAGGHRLGPEDAPVTIIEFGDYQCSFCREAEEHMAVIREKYADEVALVFRHYPIDIHSASYSAARAAECAGDQGVFWPYHQLLFSTTAWQIGNSVEVLKELGSPAGVEDLTRFHECVESEDMLQSIADDIDAAFVLGVRGTPTFLVNGLMSIGVLDSLEFEEIYKEVR